MKARGTVDPGKFSIEKLQNKPGLVTVRFYEGARPYEETVNGTTFTGWEYNEYHMTLRDLPGLEADILDMYDTYLDQAKLQDIRNREYDPIQNMEQQEKLEQARADIDYISIMTGVDLT